MSAKHFIFILLLSYSSNVFSITPEQAALFFETLQAIGLPYNHDPQLPRHSTQETLREAKTLHNEIRNAFPHLTCDAYTAEYTRTLMVGVTGVIHWIERAMDEQTT